MYRGIIRLGSRSFSSLSIVRSAYSSDVKRKTVGDIRALYEKKEPITVVTAYDYITGGFAEAADMDINLIGDSLAMTALGYEDTNEISLEEFKFHAMAVARGNKKSLLVADLTFGSFETSPEEALKTSIRLIKESRVQAVKLEGGSHMVPTVKKLTMSGIPVMGHVGLTPQYHNAFGGYKLQGSSIERALEIYHDCLALQKAGAFSIVLECIPNKLAEQITARLSIPTIGIGAGPHCSGQVLVLSDLLGMSKRGTGEPKFVKRYGDIYSSAVASLLSYRDDVKKAKFPNADAHGYKMKKEVFADFKRLMDTEEVPKV